MSTISAQILALLPDPVVTPILRSLYADFVGSPLESFDFAKAPLSSPEVVYSLAAAYLVVIFPYFRIPFLIHNLFLSFASFVLFVAYAENVAPIILRHGLVHAMCHPDAFTRELVVLYYLNYLTKYYEWVDTVFLVLNGSRLEFLHWYHHVATMVLCFIQLEGTPSVQWVVIILNLLVHTIMYGYYALATLEIEVWWKRYITTMQITQFVIDLVAVYWAAYYATYHHWRPAVPSVFADLLRLPAKPTIQCTGSLLAAYFGCALLTSYLLLFIQFYIKTYKKKAAAAAATKGKAGAQKKKSKIE
ncbi:GNS1/SUR4 family-domain-containing protein [Catenaria anguillulae PL171]|uniref:Elongation of fatty acids protein n=1 Tax=Catenaria anguillulae PL171 TaxID=765915 RepID=A0A1Y2HQG5_9FUNG|nr:GNS1/SUR4 family-domain-containing protein [Catenaria anguillulae PL171]